jgi:hypothetical protein
MSSARADDPLRIIHNDYFPNKLLVVGSDKKGPLVNLREHFIKHAWQGDAEGGAANRGSALR